MQKGKPDVCVCVFVVTSRGGKKGDHDRVATIDKKGLPTSKKNASNQHSLTKHSVHIPETQNTACRGFNICHQKECAGGTPENRCDLKTFSGEPSYYPDQTATSGDGYMSQYVISRN